MLSLFRLKNHRPKAGNPTKTMPEKMTTEMDNRNQKAVSNCPVAPPAITPTQRAAVGYHSSTNSNIHR